MMYRFAWVYKWILTIQKIVSTQYKVNLKDEYGKEENLEKGGVSQSCC